MTPSDKRLIALGLLCISLIVSFFALGLQGFVITKEDKVKPTPSITEQAAYEVRQVTKVKKINNQNLKAELVTYEDGTVCVEIGLTRVECWHYVNNEDTETTKTFIIYD